MGYSKYKEDDVQRTAGGQYIQERCGVEPWIRVKAACQDDADGSTKVRPKLPRPIREPSYLWFAEGVQVEPKGNIVNKLKLFWGGRLFKLPFQAWIVLGRPPDGCQRPALGLRHIRMCCEIAHTAGGGVIRVLAGSKPISIRGYRIRDRFNLQDLDQVFSGVFFLATLPSGPPSIAALAEI